MYDIVIARVRCVHCNKAQTHGRVAFYAVFGTYYSCGRQSRLGVPFPGLPPIPAFDEEGEMVCRDCKKTTLCLIAFRHGVPTRVTPMMVAGVRGLPPPLPHDPRKLVRRTAHAREAIRRACVEPLIPDDDTLLAELSLVDRWSGPYGRIDGRWKRYSFPGLLTGPRMLPADVQQEATVTMVPSPSARDFYFHAAFDMPGT